VTSYFGLDLTGSARPAAFATLDSSGALTAVGLLVDDTAIFGRIIAAQPRIVAIDCPLGLPLGLCCLDPACACTPARNPGIRLSEIAVRERGYSLYHTTKRSIIRSMVERGIALRRNLEASGLIVIEVYPFATKCALFGRPKLKKSSPEGRAWLQDRVASVVPGVEALQRPLTHDELDSILCAHTARLYANGDAEALGDPDEGTIVVPRLPVAAEVH
jgi:predicted nuclease with RNAse H fold